MGWRFQEELRKGSGGKRLTARGGDGQDSRPRVLFENFKTKEGDFMQMLGSRFKLGGIQHIFGSKLEGFLKNFNLSDPGQQAMRAGDLAPRRRKQPRKPAKDDMQTILILGGCKIPGFVNQD